MNNQIPVGMARYAPIEPPFEHRKSLVERQGLEWRIPIGKKQYLGFEPPPQVMGRGEADMKICKAILLGQRVIGIKQADVFCHAGNRGLQVGGNKACLEAYAGMPEAISKFWKC